MKLYIITIILVLSCPKLYTQFSGYHHFEVHGYGQENLAMKDVKDRVNTLDDFPVNGSLLTWNSSNIYGYNAIALREINDNLDINNKKNYVGIGYSMGGLITRSIIHTQGLTPVPAPTNVDYEAFVTLNTPHQGAMMIRNWNFFMVNWINQRTQMARGEWGNFLASFAGSIFYGVYAAIVPFIATYSIISGPTRDGNPGSSYLNSINSTTNLAIENSLKKGAVIIHSLWGDWKFPSFNSSEFFTGASGYSAAGREDYIGHIDRANRFVAKHQNRENSLRAKDRWWKPWIWPQRVYHRSRVGAWSATRNSYYYMETIWNIATTIISNDWNSFNKSDGYIDSHSQQNKDNYVTAFNSIVKLSIHDIPGMPAELTHSDVYARAPDAVEYALTIVLGYK